MKKVLTALLLIFAASATAQSSLSVGAAGIYHSYGEENFYGLSSAGAGLSIRWQTPERVFLQGKAAYFVSEPFPVSPVKFYELTGGVGYGWKNFAAGVDISNTQFPDDEFVGGWSGGAFAQFVLQLSDIEVIAGGRVSPFNIFPVRSERLYFQVHYLISK